MSFGSLMAKAHNTVELANKANFALLSDEDMLSRKENRNFGKIKSQILWKNIVHVSNILIILMNETIHNCLFTTSFSNR